MDERLGNVKQEAGVYYTKMKMLPTASFNKDPSLYRPLIINH